MGVLSPNRADVFRRGEAPPALSGKVANYRADVFLRSETLPSLAPPNSAPVNIVAPAVTGTTQVGSVLTTTTGTWTGDVSSGYTYQWKDAGGNIGGATSSTYTLVDADDATTIHCTVTATGIGGATTRDSNSVGAITEPVATNSVAPTISGSASQGSTLTCNSNGTWAHMAGTVHTFAYQWTRAGSNITGATSSTYQTVNLDVGHAIGVKVTATNTGGTSSATASSNTVTPTTAGFHTGTRIGYMVMGAALVDDFLSLATGRHVAPSIAPSIAPGVGSVRSA